MGGLKPQLRSGARFWVGLTNRGQAKRYVNEEFYPFPNDPTADVVRYGDWIALYAGRASRSTYAPEVRRFTAFGIVLKSMPYPVRNGHDTQFRIAMRYMNVVNPVSVDLLDTQLRFLRRMPVDVKRRRIVPPSGLIEVDKHDYLIIARFLCADPLWNFDTRR
ncbi:EVE domain-containing protein [Plasmodiophora brassicae]